MSKEETVVASHAMVADGFCIDAKNMAAGWDGPAAAGIDTGQEVTVLVAMPLRLKRKLHVEAKRRQQSLSEFICARCDFREVDT